MLLYSQELHLFYIKAKRKIARIIIHLQESRSKLLFLLFLFATKSFIVRNTKDMTNIQTIVSFCLNSACA